jgi:mannan endo-1,4-beta-mannosidase
MLLSWVLLGLPLLSLAAPHTLEDAARLIERLPELGDHGITARQLHGYLSGPGPYPQNPPWVPPYPTTFDVYCAPNASQTVGTFAGPTLPSLDDLLKRSAFVTRQGTQLELLGQPFRMVGPCVYWL